MCGKMNKLTTGNGVRDVIALFLNNCSMIHFDKSESLMGPLKEKQ